MTRAAAQVGTAWVRVAAEGRLVVELPAAAASLRSILTGLFDAPVQELVVVHGAGVSPSAWRLPRAAVGTVRTVPAAVAALAQHAASTRSAVPHAVVADVGHDGAEVAHVCAGRVVAVRRVAVGGARLDAVTAAVLARSGVSVEPNEARRVREALSLLPEVHTGTPPVAVSAADLEAALALPLAAVVHAVVDAVHASVLDATAGRAPPVLLVGGIARTPLLAELLDAAGVDDVRVAERPDAAAVLGALRVPGVPVARGPSDPWCPGATPDRAHRETRSASPPAQPWRAVACVPETAPTTTWLPPVVPARHRRTRAVLVTLAAAAGAIGLLAAGAALPAAPPATAPAAGDLVQYGYAVRLPAGWAHTGGLPERRRSLLTPATAPDGSDLISVERTPLGYDADAEPRRARAELRARFAAAVAEGAALSAFDDDARFAGRPVVSYREAGGGTAGDVDWYVVLDGDAQLSVGCRHTAAGKDAVGAACATVVGSLHRTV